MCEQKGWTLAKWRSRSLSTNMNDQIKIKQKHKKTDSHRQNDPIHSIHIWEMWREMHKRVGGTGYSINICVVRDKCMAQKARVICNKFRDFSLIFDWNSKVIRINIKQKVILPPTRNNQNTNTHIENCIFWFCSTFSGFVHEVFFLSSVIIVVEAIFVRVHRVLLLLISWSPSVRILIANFNTHINSCLPYLMSHITCISYFRSLLFFFLSGPYLANCFFVVAHIVIVYVKFVGCLTIFTLVVILALVNSVWDSFFFFVCAVFYFVCILFRLANRKTNQAHSEK